MSRFLSASSFVCFMHLLLKEHILRFKMCFYNSQVDVNDTYGTYDYDTVGDYSTVEDTNDYYDSMN